MYAIEWLEKAKTAPRYEPRHFPTGSSARSLISRTRFEGAESASTAFPRIRSAPGERPGSNFTRAHVDDRRGGGARASLRRSAAAREPFRERRDDDAQQCDRH